MIRMLSKKVEEVEDKQNNILKLLKKKSKDNIDQYKVNYNN